MTTDTLKTQKLKDGYGATYHRIYSVTVNAPEEKVTAAIEELKSDMNQFSPQVLARFEKTVGEPTTLKNNDEFLIHITGPWNGPVRVSEVSDRAFHLKTLEGHLEAGEIKFEIKNNKDHEYTFQIESLARSRDAIVDLVYDKIPIAKFAQTEMWTQFCKNFAEKVVGPADENANPQSATPEVHILTERFNEETGQWETI